MKKIFIDEKEYIYTPSKSYFDTLAEQVKYYFEDDFDVVEGDVIFDVGANIGLFAREALRRTNNKCQIYCFEPIPDTFEYLIKNTKGYLESRNLLAETIKPYNIGLSNKSGFINFYHYKNCPSVSTYSDDNQKEFENSVESFKSEFFNDTEKSKSYRKSLPIFLRVLPRFIQQYILTTLTNRHRAKKKITCQITPLSQFIRENNILKIDYIKIDVEGAELDVLEGIEEVHWPIISKLIIEVHDKNGRLELIDKLLSAKGFKTKVLQEEDFKEQKANIFNISARR